MKSRIIASLLLVLLFGNHVYSQAPAATTKSHKYRTVFTLVGAGGGFALGVFAGLAAFDDSVNSDRKVWTTALVSAAGGAIGGYFIGRSLDNRHVKRTSAVLPNDLLPAAKAALAALSEPKHAGVKPAPTNTMQRDPRSRGLDAH